MHGSLRVEGSIVGGIVSGEMVVDRNHELPYLSFVIPEFVSASLARFPRVPY